MPQLGDKMARAGFEPGSLRQQPEALTTIPERLAEMGRALRALVAASPLAASRFLKDGLRPPGVVVTGYKGHSPLMTRA